MKKSEAVHRQSSSSEYSKWISFKATQSVNEHPISLGNERSQQAAFRTFLRQREVSYKMICLTFQMFMVEQ